MALEGRERPFLIRAHEARIRGDIGAEDRCQPPLNALFRHDGPLKKDILTASSKGVTTSLTVLRQRRRASCLDTRRTSLRGRRNNDADAPFRPLVRRSGRFGGK